MMLAYNVTKTEKAVQSIIISIWPGHNDVGFRFKDCLEPNIFFA